jgi:hypothetical protein
MAFMYLWACLVEEERRERQQLAECSALGQLQLPASLTACPAFLRVMPACTATHLLTILMREMTPSRLLPRFSFSRCTSSVGRAGGKQDSTSGAPAQLGGKRVNLPAGSQGDNQQHAFP